MNTYNEQAKQFLKDTNTTLEIVKAPEQKSPIWAKDGKHGINYIVTLSNKNHTYTFDFWGSIADKEKLELAKEARQRGIYSPEWFEIKYWCNKQASATVPTIIKNNSIAKDSHKEAVSLMVLKNIIETVEILIKPTEYDILACLSPLYEDTLEDFCSSFGYDPDSRTAEKIFNNCIEQDRKLRKLFTHEQLEKLVEIN